MAVVAAALAVSACTSASSDTTAGASLSTVATVVTTSIPEAADSGRNWDYRFCWLRDSYFVVQALNRLGATTTMVASGGDSAIPSAIPCPWGADAMRWISGACPVGVMRSSTGRFVRGTFGGTVRLRTVESGAT